MGGSPLPQLMFFQVTWPALASRVPPDCCPHAGFLSQGGWVRFLKSLHQSLDKSYLWCHHHSQHVVYFLDDFAPSLLLKGFPFVLSTAVLSAWNTDAPSKNAWLFILGISLCACMPKSLQSCPTLCDPMDHSSPGFCPWDSPGKNTGVCCHALLQGIFLSQGSNPCLLSLHWQALYHWCHLGSLGVSLVIKKYWLM